MKNSIRKGLVGLAGTVAVCFITIGGYKIAKHEIGKMVRQKITQYEQKDLQRTEEDKRYRQLELQKIDGKLDSLKYYTDSELLKYEQKDRKWTKQKFETRVPLEELAKAFNSTYKIFNEPYYKTDSGEVIMGSTGYGSGLLFKGGYYLTAKHVVNKKFPKTGNTGQGFARYDHNKLSLDGGYELEKVVLGKDLDYALLKLKDSKNLPFYSYGFNLPTNVNLGMQSIAVGFPTGIKNIRLGNVSQIGSGKEKNYLLFKNSIIAGDSGGPLFVIENGKIKFTAISLNHRQITDINFSNIYHPINIGGGLKTSVILKDMRKQLKSGNMKEKYVKELENFLRLNK